VQVNVKYLKKYVQKLILFNLERKEGAIITINIFKMYNMNVKYLSRSKNADVAGHPHMIEK